jgi:hypothetical protein
MINVVVKSLHFNLSAWYEYSYVHRENICKNMVLPNLWYWKDGKNYIVVPWIMQFLHIHSAFSSQNVGNFEKHAYINICTWNVEATFQPSNWILAYCEVEERNYCYVWGLVKTMPKTWSLTNSFTMSFCPYSMGELLYLWRYQGPTQHISTTLVVTFQLSLRENRTHVHDSVHMISLHSWGITLVMDSSNQLLLLLYWESWWCM